MPRVMPCNRGCGAQVYFDSKHPQGLSPTGSWRPLDWATKQPHQCPNFAPSQRPVEDVPVATHKEIEVPVVATAAEPPEGLKQRLIRMEGVLLELQTQLRHIEAKIDQILTHFHSQQHLAQAEANYDKEREDGWTALDH